NILAGLAGGVGTLYAVGARSVVNRGERHGHHIGAVADVPACCLPGQLHVVAVAPGRDGVVEGRAGRVDVVRRQNLDGVGVGWRDSADEVVDVGGIGAGDRGVEV